MKCAHVVAPSDALRPQASHTLGVMRGLDPRIHEATLQIKPYGCHSLRFIMDCRVKPGNDALRGQHINREPSQVTPHSTPPSRE